jgi:hypothetical protein
MQHTSDKKIHTDRKHEVSAETPKLRREDNIKWILKGRGCVRVDLAESGSEWAPGADFCEHSEEGSRLLRNNCNTA